MGDRLTPYVTLICLCGRKNTFRMTGNNNADGKWLCECGRHITVHLRRDPHSPRTFGKAFFDGLGLRGDDQDEL
jgi:hypothetical protein